MNPFTEPLASKIKRPNPLLHLQPLLEADDTTFSNHAARLVVTVLKRDSRWSNEDRPRFDGHPILFKIHRPAGDLPAQWVCAIWEGYGIAIMPDSIIIDKNEISLKDLSNSDLQVI